MPLANPFSIEHEAESFTLSRQEQIGWVIGGVIGAALIGTSLCGVFGALGWIVLDFYEAHSELITAGEGNKLLFYREAVVVPPEGIRAFLEEALVVRSLFPPKV